MELFLAERMFHLSRWIPTIDKFVPEISSPTSFSAFCNFIVVDSRANFLEKSTFLSFVAHTFAKCHRKMKETASNVKKWKELDRILSLTHSSLLLSHFFDAIFLQCRHLYFFFLKAHREVFHSFFSVQLLCVQVDFFRSLFFRIHTHSHTIQSFHHKHTHTKTLYSLWICLWRASDQLEIHCIVNNNSSCTLDYSLRDCFMSFTK